MDRQRSAHSVNAGAAIPEAPQGEPGSPVPFRIRDFDGSVDEWLRRCRWQLAAALDGHIELNGRPILPAQDFEDAFWHAVTAQVAWSPVRVLDLGRCAIMGQLWDRLERLAAGDPQVVAWHDYKGGAGTGKRRRKYLFAAPSDFAFVVQLKERPGVVTLFTAYPCSPDRLRRRAAAAA